MLRVVTPFLCPLQKELLVAANLEEILTTTHKKVADLVSLGPLREVCISH